MMASPVKSIILTVILAVASFLVVPELVRSVIHMFKHINAYWWFLGGGALYFVSIFILRKNLTILQVYSHESLHLFACLLMFRKIDSLTATATKGGVVHFYGDSNMFIALTPYTIPLLTILLLMVQAMIPPRFGAFSLVTGYTLFFYLHSFMVQAFVKGNTDIQRHGTVPSALYIIAVLSLNVAICLLAVEYGFFKGVGVFCREIWRSCVYLFS